MRPRHAGVPAVFAVVFLSLSASIAIGQPVDDLRKEVEALKQDQVQIQRELSEIRELLRARGGSPQASGGVSDVRVTIQGAPTLGQDTARVTIVEFSDYQCPFCRRHSTQVLPELVKDYVKTGKVRYVFRDFPIASLHPQAHRLHEAAHCAGDQGRYWHMHDRLFEDPRRTDSEDLVMRARALGLDVPRFERCAVEGVHGARVRQSVAEGQRARVRGTPTFFLGLTERDGAPIRSRRLLVGAQPYEVFRQAIEDLLIDKP